MKSTPSKIVKADTRSARRFAEETSVARVRRMLDRARLDLERRLRETLALGAGEDSFTAAQLGTTLEQIRAVLRDLKSGMRSELVDGARVAAEKRGTDLLRYIQDSDRKYRGVASRVRFDEAAMLDRVRSGTEASVLRRIAGDPSHPGRPGVLERYGTSVVGKFEETLQNAVLTRKPIAEVRADLTVDSPFLRGAPAHWAERIVRTELMGASNRAGWETIRQADATLGDMLKILSATFDDRTGSDSYAVHGQIRRPNEAFQSWFGLYQHPPNRPNDREVVLPHRASWPIPASLKPKTDAEVMSRWLKERRKGAPPPRPKMSTVDVAALASAAKSA